jgi:hypothetical protein
MQEESLAKRKEKVRGIASLHQVHMLHMVTKDPIDTPAKQKKHFAGTTKGDLLGPITMPSWDHSWPLAFLEKRKLYGKMRVAVGGSTLTGGDDDDEEQEDPDENALDPAMVPPTVKDSLGGSAEKRKDENMEPVFYNSYPMEYYAELVSMFNMVDVVHLSAADGCCAKACMDARIGYIGLCFTDFHVEALTDHLEMWMLGQFANEKSTFYQPTYSLGQSGDKEKDKEKKKEPKAKQDKEKEKEKKKESKGQKRKNADGETDETEDAESSSSEKKTKKQKKDPDARLLNK